MALLGFLTNGYPNLAETLATWWCGMTPQRNAIVVLGVPSS